MTAPLIDAPRMPCGCPAGGGHTCCPPWMDAAGWPETCADNGFRRQDQVECETAPGPGALTPGDAEGLTTNLSKQEGART